MLVNTKYRSTALEIMDNLSMKGKVLQKTLDQIAQINKRLGGNHLTINGLHTLLKAKSKNSTISIIDLGCGNGDMLRTVAAFGRKHNYTFKLIGIDANKYTVNYARDLSTDYPEITYIKLDVLSDAFLELEYDIVLATLFLHHFTDDESENLLQSLLTKATTGIIINDLHRCKTAYYLFKIISIFISNSMVRNDGAISILRGFKKRELNEISENLQGTVSYISWKWAFRYQWIIRKL